MASPLTLDTGALIGFERNKREVVAVLEYAWRARMPIYVPTVVVTEAWRGGRRSARVASLLKACRVVPLLEIVARRAGEAMASVRGATAIDAIVVATARASASSVVTSDLDDLRRLADHFDVGLVAV
jgi:predicted nucleic acid-binding protein